MKRMRFFGALLLSAVMMASVLTACDDSSNKRKVRYSDEDDDEVEETEDTEETEETSTSEETSDTTVEETTTETTAEIDQPDDQEYELEATIVSMTYGDDEGNLRKVKEVYMDGLSEIMYPDLVSSLNEINAYSEADVIQEQDHLKVEYGYETSIYTRNICILRSDSTLFSIVVTEDYMLYNDAYDSMHLSSAEGYIFDTKTGTRLEGDDIFDTDNYDWRSDLSEKIDMSTSELEDALNSRQISFAFGKSSIYAVRNLPDETYTMSQLSLNTDENYTLCKAEYILEGDYIEDVSWCANYQYETPTFIAFYNDPETGEKVDLNMYGELAADAATPADCAIVTVNMSCGDKQFEETITGTPLDIYRLVCMDGEYYLLVQVYSESAETYILSLDPDEGIESKGTVEGVVRSTPIFVGELNMQFTAEPQDLYNLTAETYWGMMGGCTLAQPIDISEGTIKYVYSTNLSYVLPFNTLKLAKDIEALNIDTNEVETLEANTIVEPFYAYKEGMDFNVGDRRYTIAFELTNSGYEYDGVSIDEYITVID